MKTIFFNFIKAQFLGMLLGNEQISSTLHTVTNCILYIFICFPNFSHLLYGSCKFCVRPLMHYVCHLPPTTSKINLIIKPEREFRKVRNSSLREAVWLCNSALFPFPLLKNSSLQSSVQTDSWDEGQLWQLFSSEIITSSLAVTSPSPLSSLDEPGTHPERWGFFYSLQIHFTNTFNGFPVWTSHELIEK